MLEKYVFDSCAVSSSEIEILSKSLLENGMKSKTYEQAAYAIYFALKYRFKLSITSDMLIATEDCVLLVLGFLYFKREKDKVAVNVLKDYAKNLAKDSNEMERMWLFVYEALPQTELHDEQINISCEMYFEVKIYLERHILIHFEHYCALFGIKHCTILNNRLILFGIIVMIYLEDYSEVFYGKVYDNERSI